MGERKRLCIVDPSFSLDSPTMKHLVYAIPFLIDAGWLVTVIAEKIESDLPVEFQHVEPRIKIPIIGNFDFCGRVQRTVRDFRVRYPKAVIVGTPAMPYGAHVGTVHFLQHLWLRIARTVPGMDWRERAWLLLARIDARRARKDFSSNSGTIWLPVSESIASELRKVVATPEKVNVLPNSYDESRFNLDTADRFRGSKRAELNFGSKHIVFAFLCQGHHRRKGFWVAIQALAQLRKKKPDYDPSFLVIGGTPSTLARLKKTLSREIGDWHDWIHFTGMTERPEEYLAAADAFLLPSYFEAFCLAEIEAAAIGLPLMLTPHHGIEMILDHGGNGLIIDWDPTVLANQLSEFVGGVSPLGVIDPVSLRPRNFRPNVGRALTRSEYSSALLTFLERVYEDNASRRGRSGRRDEEEKIRAVGMNRWQGFEVTGLTREPILGVPVSICDYDQVMAILRTNAMELTSAYLVEAANTHVVATAHRDKRFGEAMANFDLIVPDGMPLVWYLNHIHDAKLDDRVYGPDLMRHILAAAKPIDRHFLLGGTEAELRKLEQFIARDYPQAKIAGSYSPPFGTWPADEEGRIIQLLRESTPTFVWVGLGCPKQELLLARLKSALPPAIYLGVGAAFSLIGGTVKQAPPSWQRLGLEWAFRLLMEPRRLWRRYLVNNTYFLAFAGLDLLRKVSTGRDP